MASTYKNSNVQLAQKLQRMDKKAVEHYQDFLGLTEQMEQMVAVILGVERYNVCLNVDPIKLELLVMVDDPVASKHPVGITLDSLIYLVNQPGFTPVQFFEHARKGLLFK